ncbi:MAG: CoA transferase subunit A [Dehalococcoidia bacterium]|nr:CoA transferase subunit A [Dehalococcoidia bacterium]
MNKVFQTFDEAVADIPDGASIGMDSWAIAVTPQNLIHALRRKGVKDLTIVTHCLIPVIWPEDKAVSPSVLLPQVKKVITSVVGIQQLGAGAFLQEHIERGLEVELTSTGTLSSRLYAGAARLAGFYNPVGVGTVLEEGKEKRVFDGMEYLLEKPIRVDYAFITAHKADGMGNLVYQGICRGDHPMMAMAADVTIAEVDRIVETGELDSESIVTPGIFVDRIVEIPESGYGTARKLKDLITALAEIEDAKRLMFREGR